MAYAADKKPLELTELTSLATGDGFVVGDADDATEVAKYITKANLEADLTPALADAVTTNANLTGHVTSTGNATVLGSFTKAQLDTAVSDDTILYDSELTDLAAVKATADCSIAEVDTGTDTAKFVTPDALQGSKRNIRWLTFNLIDAGTACTVASFGGDFVSPIAGVIQQSDTTPFYLYATNSTAGTTGTMVVDININGTSIMTTNKLDFDTGEKTTTTAATPPDLTTTALAVGDIITFDVDSLHTTPASGLTVYMGVLES